MTHERTQPAGNGGRPMIITWADRVRPAWVVAFGLVLSLLMACGVVG